MNEKRFFFSVPQFTDWKEATPDHQTYEEKYYKGLGTCDPNEARQYFKDIELYRVVFKRNGKTDDEYIRKAFDKKAVEERKKLIEEYREDCRTRKVNGEPQKYLYVEQTKQITYTEFVLLELVPFWYSAIVRSIACLIDGLKPTQCKVIYAMLKRKINSKIKVTEVSAHVSEITPYNHGNASMCEVIIKLAQNYVGSNNINIFEAIGQFGSRLMGGKDSASPRYIYTKLTKLAALIFRPEDNPLLSYQSETNEPLFLLPVCPMILINGCEGIGVGCNTTIPKHDPCVIINIIRKKLKGEKLSQKDIDSLKPYYRGFKGDIIPNADKNNYKTEGIFCIVEENKIEVTELPVGMWTETYKENVLERLLKIGILENYEEYHTERCIKFICQFVPSEFQKIKARKGFMNILQLSSDLKHGEFNALDENYCLQKFSSIIQILEEYLSFRIKFYGKRKSYREGELKATAAKLENQAKYIKDIFSNDSFFKNKRNYKDFVKYLITKCYDSNPVKAWQKSLKKDEVGEETDREEASEYDYILGMPTGMMTVEHREELLSQRDLALSELEALRAKTPEELWIQDLDEVEAALIALKEEEKSLDEGTFAEGQDESRNIDNHIPIRTNSVIDNEVEDIQTPSASISNTEPKESISTEELSTSNSQILEKNQRKRSYPLSAKMLENVQIIQTLSASISNTEPNESISTEELSTSNSQILEKNQRKRSYPLSAKMLENVQIIQTLSASISNTEPNESISTEELSTSNSQILEKNQRKRSYPLSAEMLENVQIIQTLSASISNTEPNESISTEELSTSNSQILEKNQRKRSYPLSAEMLENVQIIQTLSASISNTEPNESISTEELSTSNSQILEKNQRKRSYPLSAKMLENVQIIQTLSASISNTEPNESISTEELSTSNSQILEKNQRKRSYPLSAEMLENVQIIQTLSASISNTEPNESISTEELSTSNSQILEKNQRKRSYPLSAEMLENVQIIQTLSASISNTEPNESISTEELSTSNSQILEKNQRKRSYPLSAEMLENVQIIQTPSASISNTEPNESISTEELSTSNSQILEKNQSKRSYTLSAEMLENIQIIQIPSASISNTEPNESISTEELSTSNSQILEKNQRKRSYKGYACKKCKGSYNHKQSLVRHMIKKHGMKKEERSEKEKEKNYPCSKCTRSYVHKSSLAEHMIMDHGIKQKPITCFFCKEIYTNLVDFWSHLKAKHSQGGKHMLCPICSEAAERREKEKKEKEEKRKAGKSTR